MFSRYKFWSYEEPEGQELMEYVTTLRTLADQCEFTVEQCLLSISNYLSHIKSTENWYVIYSLKTYYKLVLTRPFYSGLLRYLTRMRT